TPAPAGWRTYAVPCERLDAYQGDGGAPLTCSCPRSMVTEGITGQRRAARQVDREAREGVPQ
ncbi:MAG: hypothetical protein ABSE77_18055, partial [Acidimicrobiales bacterium]